MARSEERRRILDLLALGTINVDQASELLKALGPSKEESLALPPLAPPRAVPSLADRVQQRPQAPRAPAVRIKPRFVRILIDSTKGDGGKATRVDVNVPVALAKFALRFVPSEAKAEMAAQGIDIAQLLDGFDAEFSEGKILDLHADEEDGKGSTHITIEVI
ncbi:MAG TPA: hypothetical protein VFN03_00345 [Trueperaceae bacterium]|nr:hypothetical protein [Trueperaceae bacterium]